MIAEIVGWAGTIIILIAYLLVSIKKLGPTARTFQLLNLIGSVGLGINSFVHHALPGVGINIAWMGIAIYALVRSSKTS